MRYVVKGVYLFTIFFFFFLKFCKSIVFDKASEKVNPVLWAQRTHIFHFRNFLVC